MKHLAILLLVGIIMAPVSANIIRYAGDEAGFNTAISGLSTSLINFDELTTGEIITDQYLSKGVHLFGSSDITAETHGHNKPPTSSPNCASLNFLSTEYDSFTIDLLKPAKGVGFWLIDNDYTASLVVKGSNNQTLDTLSIPAVPVGAYFIGVVSDSYDISSVTFTCGALGDGVAFDDLCVVPEPATLSLLVFGGLLLRKRK